LFILSNAVYCRTPFTTSYLSISLNTKFPGGCRLRTEQITDLATLLKSISHPYRLQILCLLQDHEMTVGEISKAIKSTDANISQHLSILRHQGIIGTRKQANFIYNRIIDNRVTSLIETMQGLFCKIEE
jgi:DNA-binding transcriptional ArsR family regulator